MTPERFCQIDELYRAALHRDSGARAAFLAQACDGDDELRRKVEALLAQDGGQELERGAFNSGELNPGAQLGPYRIERLLGAGGMGRVYKARDTRLARVVAIKVASARFSERFQREARAISALSHPNICTLYDVGPNYLVMEYVEGEALRGPVALGEALALADQILDALDAAHRKAITHRDLKPGNILRGRNGVKVLDFGLAKIEHVPASGSGSQAETETMLTAAGSILGTLPYMSPEQIEGREADGRSDIFAFGIVLYELIAGKRPFAGKTQTSLIASILKDQPQPLQKLQPQTPAGVERVLETCLEKDPEKRWQSAREVRHALQWAAAETPAKPTRAKSVRLWQGAAAVVTLIALGIAGWAFWPKAPDPASRFEAALPEDVTLTEYMSISPDGRKVVFAAEGQKGLWIREFDGPAWRPLPGTEGAFSTFWSPDSRHIAFAAGNQLKKLDISGGPPEILCAVPGNAAGSGAWNREGVILFGSWGGGAGGPIWKTSQAGGAAVPVTKIDTSQGEFYHTWPVFLEDGKHFIYFRSGPPEKEGIYIGSLDVQPEDQSRRRILASGLAAAYANGYLFFPRASTLMAQALDARRLELEDQPVPVVDPIEITWFGTGVFSVSSTGVLAYHPALAGGSIQLTWFDRQGKAIGALGQPMMGYGLSLSPDGKRAVVHDAPYDQPGDLWTVDVSSGRGTRLTFRKDVYSPGVWSPDSRRIAFSAGNSGDTLYDKSASGSGEERELFKQPGARLFVTSWSRDGRFLLYHTENNPKTAYDVWVLPLQGERKPVLLLGDPFNEWAAVFSPDMHWIAYASTETAPGHVYVRPFRVSESGIPGLGEGKWQISKDAGNWPRWPNEKEIVFQGANPGPVKFSASVNGKGAAFESEIPLRLFQGPIATWDVTSDGQRFLMAVPEVQRGAGAPISVVLNWPALLKK